MKILILLMVVVGLNACSSLKNNTTSQQIVGEWKEEWGRLSASDVAYHDIFQLGTAANGTVQINCTKRPNYRFENIVFDGNNLSFKLFNEDKKYGTATVINTYQLRLNETKNAFVGLVSTSDNKTIEIKWQKQ